MSRRPSLRKRQAGPRARDVDDLVALQRWENKKAVMYKTVDTFAAITRRKLWLKNGAAASTDGNEILVPLDDPFALLLVYHELAHVMYLSNLAARNLFVDEYVKKIVAVATQQQVPLDEPRLRGMLLFLVGVLEDRRVDSLWGILFPGTEKMKRERDAEVLTKTVPDPHQKLLMAFAFVVLGAPLPPGQMDRFRPYFEEARRKVELRGYAATLAVAKWLVTMLVTEVIRDSRALPPPPPQACPPAPDPDHGEGDCPPPEGSGEAPEQGATAAPNGAGAPEGDEDGGADPEAPPEPWQPPQDAPNTTPQERAVALQALVDQTGGEEWQPLDDLAASKYPKRMEEEAAKQMVAGVMRLDVNNQPQMAQGLKAGLADMEALIARAHQSVRAVIEGDAWLRKGAMARVVFKDVQPSDVAKAPPPLSSADRDTIRRLRALFNRVMGRVRSMMDDSGTEIDVPAYIQYRLTGESTPCFRHELRGQGFKSLLLVDRSGSMAGWKAQQVERAARVVKRALDYPFVERMMWGFQSLGHGQLDLSRMAEGVETFETKKSAVGGVTPLNVAVRVAARQLEQGNEAKQLIVITDGMPVYTKRDGAEYNTLSLLLWTRDEIHKARQHGVNVTGVIIGDELSDHMVSLVFGPSRYWKRITVEHAKDAAGHDVYDKNHEPVMIADRLGSELVSLIASSFIEYLKRG
jgi:hypothetical protein